MDLVKEEAQRQEFRAILYDLAKSQELLANKMVRASFYTRLEALYHTPSNGVRFRHFYSDVFSVLSTVKQGDADGSIDVLGQNLAEIRKGYQANKNKDELGKPIDITDSIRKLYDHVSLDIARMGYSDAADREVSQESSIAEVQGQVNELKDDVLRQSKAINKSLGDAKNAQKEYIAILGIFAAVVLAFTGGIAFSTSVLQNIHSASIYRLVLVASIIGLVLVNVLFGLFYYIDRIVKQEKGRIKPLIISNLVMMALIAMTVWAWNTGKVEQRNERMKELQRGAVIEQEIEPEGSEGEIDSEKLDGLKSEEAAS